MANQNKGGRPRKKPGYDKDKEVQRLIDRAVKLYGDPYDDRDERPETAPTLQSVAEEMGTTTVRVRKILITAGCYTTAQSRRVAELVGLKGTRTRELLRELAEMGKIETVGSTKGKRYIKK